jgi:hypothetical protein
MLWQAYCVLVADGLVFILALMFGVTLKSWWRFFRGVRPNPGCTPTSISCHFKDGSRVIASPGSLIVRVGQPGTTIAIHAPDDCLVWSGRITEVDDR